MSGFSPEQLNSMSMEDLIRLRDQLRQKSGSVEQGVKDAYGMGRSEVSAYDPKQDFFSRQNMGSMASNVIPSLVGMGEDMKNLVTSPMETGKALYDAGPSGILKALGERYGGVDALKKTAVEDPFGLSLDVAPGMTALGGAAKATGLGGKIGRVAAAASEVTPWRGAARAAELAGKGSSMGFEQVAGLLTGKDVGAIATARNVLAPNMANLTEQFSKGGKVAASVAKPQAVNFAKEQRAAFAGARKGMSPDAIPEAARAVEKEINAELNRVAEAGKAQFQNTPVNPQKYYQFTDDLLKELESERGIRVTPKGLDMSQSVMPKDGGASTSIGDALDFIFEPLNKPDPSIGDVWMARRRLDEAETAALGRKAGFAGAEDSALQLIKKRLQDYIDTIDDPAFKQFNADYAAGAQMRERFAREITGAGAAGKSPEAQISSVLRSIKEGRGSSEAFLTRIEAQTGIPLRAIAAGKELSDLMPSGLIGRGIFASALFGSASGLTPETTFLLFAGSPRVLSRTMQGMGFAERQVQKASAVSKAILSNPAVAQLAEQGMNFGTIIQQLDRQGLLKEQQPTIMGRIGSAANR